MIGRLMHCVYMCAGSGAAAGFEVAAHEIPVWREGFRGQASMFWSNKGMGMRQGSDARKMLWQILRHINQVVFGEPDEPEAAGHGDDHPDGNAKNLTTLDSWL